MCVIRIFFRSKSKCSVECMLGPIVCCLFCVRCDNWSLIFFNGAICITDHTMEENIISEGLSEYTEDESAPWNGMDLNKYARYLIVKYFSIALLRFATLMTTTPTYVIVWNEQWPNKECAHVTRSYRV